MSSFSNINKILSAASQDIIFEPTPEMRRAKAAFWSSVDDTSLVPDNLTLAAATSLGADKKLTRWWSIPGFTEWWQNKQEFKQRLEYLAQLALDSLEEVLTDPNANATAKVNTAKLILDAANKMPSKAPPQDSIPEKLAAMSRNELEEYVKSKVKYLTPTADFDTVASDRSDGDLLNNVETRTTRTPTEGNPD